jgi:hypothetical protein
MLALCVLAGRGALDEAQAQQADKEQIISIFRVAPGKHLDFLKWQAEREAVAKEAGAPNSAWYVHHNGDSWDFISIVPQADPQQQAALDDKIEQLAKQKGLTTGAAAALEFRQFIAVHTDTFSGGPFTAAELVQQATGR